MRGQADTCTARLAAVLDEASTAGSSAEPYWCGRLMNDLYPDRREAVRPHGGRCCARKLRLRMAPTGQSHGPPRWTVRLALATSCAEACAESAASPARLDCMFEQFLTILSQPLMQLAGISISHLSSDYTLCTRSLHNTHPILNWSHLWPLCWSAIRTASVPPRTAATTARHTSSNAPGLRCVQSCVPPMRATSAASLWACR